MEFREILENTLGDRLPKNPRLSPVTKRVILSQEDYERLQIDFVWSDYNMWCAGVNMRVNPNSDPNLPFFNYVKTGDAKNFSDLFTTEAEAEREAEQVSN
jgi:hypothetical protein